MENIIMNRVKIALFAVLLVASSTVANMEDTFLEAGNIIGQAVRFVDQCGGRDFSLCLKERALKYFENTSGNIDLTEGVTLRETNPEKHEIQNVSKPSLPDEPRARENTINNLLMNRVTKFFESHTLEFKFPKSSIVQMKRSMDAEEGRKKRRRILLPLLILFTLKAATILPVFIGAVAVIALKALLAGKVALVVTGLVALKKLLEAKEASQTYEVVAHPHHTHSHITSIDDHHGHLRRTIIEDPNNIPYSAYIQSQGLLRNE